MLEKLQSRTNKKSLVENINEPKTNKIYNNLTKRVWFQRRPEMSNKPVLILIFEGLLGEYKLS
jgi:hypothetical protein